MNEVRVGCAVGGVGGSVVEGVVLTVGCGEERVDAADYSAGLEYLVESLSLSLSDCLSSILNCSLPHTSWSW